MKRILLIFLFVLLATPCFAEVIITTKTKYYSVDGIGKKEIRLNHQEQAPSKGKYYYTAATAQPLFRYEYSVQQEGYQCSVTSATVYLHIIYTYPRLSNQQDPKTQKWWDKSVKKFEVHELFHGEIAKECAKELEDVITGIKNVYCENIDQLVKLKTSTIIMQHRTRQAKYEYITEHGLKQRRYKGTPQMDIQVNH